MRIVEDYSDLLLPLRLVLDNPGFSGVCTRSAQTVATVERGLLADFRLRRFAATAARCPVFVLVRNQQATKRVQVAPQDGQLHVSFKTNL